MFGALAYLATAAAAQAPERLLPVDEAPSRPDFFSFRAQLQDAIARHDADAVMSVVDPNIKASFGGDDGVEAFQRLWRPTEAGSELWGKLGAVLALGGTFQDEQTFIAPYTFSRWPDKYDSFEHVALIAANVRIREEPRADASALATMSFAILPLVRNAAQDNDAWTAVQLAGKRVGYVASRLVRSPIDYRAFFTRSEGRWRLTMFLAGD